MVEFKSVEFKIGNEEYGVDINQVRSIEMVLPIVPMQNLHDINTNIKGVIKLRGNNIPVYSLRKKFGMEDIQYTEDTKIIIVKAERLLIGLEADAVEGIQNVEENHIFEMPKLLQAEDTRYYGNIINMNGRLTVMLNMDELMSTEEFNALEEALSNL